MKVTPVDGFMTTDGNFFPNENEAKAHQHVLDIKPEIEEFVGTAYFSWQDKSAITRWEEHKMLNKLNGECA